VLGIEGSDCAWSFVDRMFLANELLDAADAAGTLPCVFAEYTPASVHRLGRTHLLTGISWTVGLACIAAACGLRVNPRCLRLPTALLTCSWPFEKPGVAAAPGPTGMAFILTWLKLSSTKQLAWYRRSNHQSKDIAHGQKVIAQRCADKVLARSSRLDSMCPAQPTAPQNAYIQTAVTT